MSIDADMRVLLEWVFDNGLDEDKSGFIEQKEANRVAKYCGMGGVNGDITALWNKMLEMDTDGDGKISKEEYVTFMATSLHGSVAAARDLKDRVDSKLNQQAALSAAYAADAGLDDLEEVALDGSAPAPPPPPPPPAEKPAEPAGPTFSEAKLKELKKKFDELDEDKNGQLTKAEVAEALLLEEDEPAMVELWKKADTDGDGHITFDEFKVAAAAFDEAMGDGPDLGL